MRRLLDGNRNKDNVFGSRNWHLTLLTTFKLHHEDTKTISEKVTEKHTSQDGYKKISKSLNIHWSIVTSTIKNWKEYYLNLPVADNPQKPSRKKKPPLVMEAPSLILFLHGHWVPPWRPTRPTTPLKEFQVSAAEMGETVLTTTVAWVLLLLRLYEKVTLSSLSTFLFFSVKVIMFFTLQLVSAAGITNLII